MIEGGRQNVETWMVIATIKILLPVVVCMVLTSLLMLATEMERRKDHE